MSDTSPPDRTVTQTDPPADVPVDQTMVQSTPPTASTAPFIVSGSPTGRAAGESRSGDTVPGYEILGELGRGGMGVVYKARQVGLNRVVALKMVLAGGYADRREFARFLAEAEAVASIRHPNVVQVYEFNDAFDRPYLTMEYLDGGSLSAAIRRAGKFTPEAAAVMVEKIARGIQAAHDHGIVHRDIKPGNVLFDEAGEPKVTDFGLAKQGGRSDLTDTNAVMGTPAYMAAGQTKFVGPAADVYALGVILYECLTGTVPFSGETAMSVVLQVVKEIPEAVRKRAPDVPRDLELICLKCLEKDPRGRYPTAAALADDLRRYATGEPVSVRPPSLGTMVRFWTRQHFGSAGWTVAGGVLSGAAGGANVFLDMFGRKVPEARAKFERLTGAAPDGGGDSVSFMFLNVAEGLTSLLVPAILLATAILVRPRSRSADLAAGVLTGLISAVTFFTVSYAWWGTYSVAVRPVVDDMALLAEPDAGALATHPALAGLPADKRRAFLAAKIHNDLLMHLPWAIVTGMVLAVTLTVPIAVGLIATAGGLLRTRGLRPIILPLFLEIGVPVVVFAIHAFLLLNRALWYGMKPQYPPAYAGLLALTAFAIWVAGRGGPWWARALAQIVWIGYFVVSKSMVLYEYE
ncbi:serine/threonine-protein kinase [Limnoglobus roseus]|uniref:non-specific serine/threonine protein kinase n=1 Tax=Limnoglobus roseus TaxID=2598579 RepID=A0A5C1AAP1_9BACT|nr:serine/threonine-protein kinase [Limnoglobus roseus]QEL14098.1 serine/threonine protein kinase [Limnoglobus roseus]